MNINYKNKYLKYKNKYLNYKNLHYKNLHYKNLTQTGGLITPAYPEVTLKTAELTHHNINCPDNQILKKLHLRRTDPPSRSIYYEFTCDRNQLLNPDNFEIPTELNDYGNGNTIYLDRHNIQCLPTYALSKIKLNKEDDLINYDYRCTDANLYDITDHETPLDTDGSELGEQENGAIYYLDKHNVECPDGKYLNSLQLVRGNDASGNTNKYQYRYKCGTMPHITHHDDGASTASPVRSVVQTPEQIEEEKIRKWSKKNNSPGGHIAADIQEQIIYGDKVKVNDIASHVTHNFENIIKKPELDQRLNKYITDITTFIDNEDIQNIHATINELLNYNSGTPEDPIQMIALKGNDNVILFNRMLETNNIDDIRDMFRKIDMYNLDVVFFTIHKPRTQSHVWCPLIWCALKLNDYDIPEDWCNFNFNNTEYNIIFNEATFDLSQNKEWVEQTVRILLE